MMVSKHQQMRDNALETKLRRAKTFAKNPQINPSWSSKHASEVREFATVGKFTELTKRIKDEHQKFIDELQRRKEIRGNVV